LYQPFQRILVIPAEKCVSARNVIPLQLEKERKKERKKDRRHGSGSVAQAQGGRTSQCNV